MTSKCTEQTLKKLIFKIIWYECMDLQPKQPKHYSLNKDKHVSSSDSAYLEFAHLNT